MTELTRGRLLSLLSLVAIAMLVYVPARVAWDRATTPPPADHGLAELSGEPAPGGISWECVVTAVETAGIPGTAEGFALLRNDDDDVDADFFIDRAVGGDLRVTIGLDGLLVTGLQTRQRVPLDCGDA